MNLYNTWITIYRLCAFVHIIFITAVIVASKNPIFYVGIYLRQDRILDNMHMEDYIMLIHD